MQTFLCLTDDLHRTIWEHLLPEKFRAEEAGFVFATQESADDRTLFRTIEWYGVPPNGFASRSRYHLELTDATRAYAIKHAHDLHASLVELHSHAGPRPAEFSFSDLMGFREFVPHVWWRLKGRPYMAVVVSKGGLDGFAWLDGPQQPSRLDGIVVGADSGRVLAPTRLSPLSLDRYDYE